MQRRESTLPNSFPRPPGFQRALPNMAERLVHLKAMPVLKPVATKDGERRYTYADPEHCHRDVFA